jgi:cytochrome c peroxidase
MINKLSALIVWLILLGFVLSFTTKAKVLIHLNNWDKPKVKFPADNPFSEESVNLGAKLFSDILFSRDTSISCQTCHIVTEALADHLEVGEGILGRTVTRNTPSLINIGLHPYFMADGKFKSLEEQVLGPINEHNEFDMSPDKVVQRIKDLPNYKMLSYAAYGRDIDIEIIQKALANFQRVIVSEGSKFDQFMEGEAELSVEEKIGWELFISDDLNCIQCHSGYNFTNYAFENNGLYLSYPDSGRALITERAEDLAKFKVPTLRNVSITHPYMHDGSIKSLEEVIDHYASGGENHKSKSRLLKGFNITSVEKKALIAFLNTLTDKRFVENE